MAMSLKSIEQKDERNHTLCQYFLFANYLIDQQFIK